MKRLFRKFIIIKILKLLTLMCIFCDEEKKLSQWSVRETEDNEEWNLNSFIAFGL